MSIGIQLDIAHPSTLIVPLTTNLIENAHPLCIRVSAQGQLEKDSDLLIDQLRAIDNQRLVCGPLAMLTDERMQCVDAAVCEVMGIDTLRVSRDTVLPIEAGYDLKNKMD